MKKLMNKKVLILLLAIPFAIVVFLFIVGLFSNLGKGNKLPISNSPSPEKTEEIRKLNPIAITKENLIGIWHESPNMPATWADHYNFYPSGKYRFYTSGMNCSATKIDESGSWELNGTQLKLTIKEETLLRGGKLVKSFGSCGTEQTLSGAVPEFNILTTPRVETHILKPVTGPVDIDGRYVIQLNEMNHTGIFIDNISFWKFDEDPTGSGEFPENITWVRANELAKNELKKRGYPYSPEKYYINPDYGNRDWNKYLDSGPADFRDKTLKKSNLENKNYLAVHFVHFIPGEHVWDSVQEVLGGDAWVFVDRDSGSIIGIIFGQ